MKNNHFQHSPKESVCVVIPNSVIHGFIRYNLECDKFSFHYYKCTVSYSTSILYTAPLFYPVLSTSHLQLSPKLTDIVGLFSSLDFIK